MERVITILPEGATWRSCLVSGGLNENGGLNGGLNKNGLNFLEAPSPGGLAAELW